MLGYLRADGTLDDAGCVDDAGWLSSGDVGRLAPDGRLFLVDRLKDVFKCDNWLVAPSEIEDVAIGHPLVRECVVFDVPDEFSGAVAAAYVVLDGSGDTDTDTVAEYVNDRVPYYQRLRRIVAVGEIPRSPNGKVQRRDLRYALIAGGSQRPTGELGAQLTVVNTFTVREPARAGEFESRFRSHVEYMREQPGFLAHQMVRYADRPDVYVNVGWWRRPQDFQRILASEVFQEHAREFHQLVDVEAAPSRSLPAARAIELIGLESPDFAVLVVERFTVTGDLDRFTAAYAAHVAAVPAEDLGWVDLSGSLRAPLSYLAVSRWASAQAHRAAQGTGPYQAVLEHSTVTVDYAASVAASRLPSTVERGSNEVAQV
jgi:long-chain acyl-CoA synthetase